MAIRVHGLAALRMFEAAAQHLSFTKAAAQLNVTPAAVSHQVRTLEDQLGIKLFRRSSRDVRLTNHGERFLRGVSEALVALAGSLEEISREKQLDRLTVTASASLSIRWIVPRISRFRSWHPDLVFRLDVSSRAVDFTGENSHVAIRFGTGNFPGLQSDLLFEEFVFPVCSPKLLNSAIPLRSPEDLRKHTLIHLDPQFQIAYWPTWRNWLSSVGLDDIDMAHGLHFSQSALALSAAIEGQGIALATTSLAVDSLLSGELVQPFEHVTRPPSGLGYYVISPPGSTTLPIAREFRTWVMNEATICAKQLAERSNALPSIDD